jgi:competence protein ComEA
MAGRQIVRRPVVTPAAERDMEPSATPPWRVLETPAPETGATRIDGRLGRAEGTASIVKVAVIAGAAVACAIAAIVIAAGDGGGTVRVDGGVPVAVDGTGTPVSTGATTGSELVVEIVGAVPKPGVYRLPPGSRVADLVQMAGGYGPRVDTERAERELNLAATVKDGEHIRVPSRDDAAAASLTPGGEGPSRGGGLIDLNTATQAELEELPGVGPATAEKIIAAREEAPFAAVDELRSRGVLGEKTFEKLRALVTVG